MFQKTDIAIILASTMVQMKGSKEAGLADVLTWCPLCIHNEGQ